LDRAYQSAPIGEVTVRPRLGIDDLALAQSPFRVDDQSQNHHEVALARQNAAFTCW
jgi:hypothetical protein